jgi:hypothetical protein
MNSLPHNNTDTSRAAAQAAAPKAPGRREIIFQLIAGRGSDGMTNDELVVATGWLIQSVCPLVNSLKKARLIRDSGLRRATRAGRAAIVWVAMEVTP